jgi:hypothetical protein
VWSKVSCPERLSVTGPKALDGERRLPRRGAVRAPRGGEFPDRVLWGTDWPHPNLKDHMPDDGLLVDFIPHIAPTAELQRKLLVDNPMRLYWPEEPDRGPEQTLSRRARHHHLRCRAEPQGLLAQPVLHEPDEGREPRPLQGRRATPTWTNGR